MALVLARRGPSGVGLDGRRGEEAAGRRRASIVETALACFTEVGYEPTTVREIGARAGASNGTMYHFFPGGKAAIAAAVHLDAQRHYQRGLLPVLAGAGAEEGIRGAVAFHLRWVRECSARAGFLFRQHPREVLDVIEPELAMLNRAFFAAIDAWLKPHVAAGWLRSLPRSVFFAVWIGPSQQLCRQRLEAGVIDTVSRAERALADAAWRALRADVTDGDREASP